ncbi:hypothetical protein BDF22DRAFT_656050 [Syncephalis plumigaleata]|nr:hypothetical protein BDF22DRAFT_656050 [Syncephalis plumigaleata]
MRCFCSSTTEQDQWTERDVALDRYRRHHDYMAELFSPYSTGQIEPPASPYAVSEEEKNKLTKELEENTDKVRVTRTQHHELKERIRHDNTQFRDALNTITNASTVEALDEEKHRLAEANLIVVDDTATDASTANGKLVELPRTPAIRVKKVAIPVDEPFPHSDRLVTL